MRLDLFDVFCIYLVPRDQTYIFLVCSFSTDQQKIFLLWIFFLFPGSRELVKFVLRGLKRQ